jgi:hypothetical protein
MYVRVLCRRKRHFFIKIDEQMILIVKNIFLTNHMRCAEKLANKQVPNKTIYRIITKFEETGSVCDRKHNRRRTVLNDDTLGDFRLSLL